MTLYDNLRDIEGWRVAGLATSLSSNECAKLLDGAIRQLVSWSDCDALGGLEGTMQKLVTAEPNAALPWAFLLALEAFGTAYSPLDPAFRRKVKEAETVAESTTINDRERKHLKAAALWAVGEMPAAEAVWESILDEYPNDLMAVRFAHDSYFFSGSAEGKRDSVARVLPKWKDDEPCKSRDRELTHELLGADRKMLQKRGMAQSHSI